MRKKEKFTSDEMKYLRLLSEKYPSIQEVCTEIINLQAILNLPKGTEHFMSDLHGEYEAFYHILNNCSGVIREKVTVIFKEILSKEEMADLCTLVYYPEQKLEMVKQKYDNLDQWYRKTFQELIDLAKVLSSKYTRSKVRKAMPKEYSYIIDELLHAQPDEDNNQLVYHKQIIDTIIYINNGNEFVIALADLIKKLAVDHLHVVGDIFDRGTRADSIMDMLCSYHSVDIEWGNHDILWMGAAAGNEACMAVVVRNSLNYKNTDVLEKGYGISLRSLALFAEKVYEEYENPIEASLKAIAVIMFKLEGKLIMRHPEYQMQDHLLLDKINYEENTILIGEKSYVLENALFPTIDPQHPYELTKEEQKIVEELKEAFKESERLHRHIHFLYEKGSMYCCYNGNLLFHGCIPLTEEGNFDEVKIQGKYYRGKEYMDYADEMARMAYFENENEDALDFMWFLWCGKKSPLSGRNIKTFERIYLTDQTLWYEEKNPYFALCRQEDICYKILKEFRMNTPISHIINGHTPVKVMEGESPLKAHGKLIVIDGGFCRAYQKTTGIAGYTLIFNSHGMRLMSHQPFESIEKVLTENKDIESTSYAFGKEYPRVMVADTDTGKTIEEKIDSLENLLLAYRKGVLRTK